MTIGFNVTSGTDFIYKKLYMIQVDHRGVGDRGGQYTLYPLYVGT